MAADQASLKVLEQFVIDNRELERLEELIGEFNLFEAVGMVHQEIHHSNFLAFLLNPSERHGLGDRFLKRFLMRVLLKNPLANISAVDIDIMELNGAVVERESHHIDILIHDLGNKLVCVIENKIFSGEHDDQLARYRAAVRHRFPQEGLRIIPIFLSPEGVAPSETDYLAMDYTTVAEVIERVRETQTSTLGPDVNTAMKHYVAMLRRHIVTDSEVVRLCQQIYQRHKAAIDLIIEHKPDNREQIADYLEALIENEPSLQLEHSAKSRVRFVPTVWDTMPALKQGTGLSSQRILVFEFYNYDNRLLLYLTIAPGKAAIRRQLFKSLRDKPDFMKRNANGLSDNWTAIYKNEFISPKQHSELTIEERCTVIDEKWRHFQKAILPQIVAYVASLQFVDEVSG